jgi:hypothetical protein
VAGLASLRPGCGDTIAGPFGNQAALELGDGAEDVEDVFAYRRGCVDLLLKRDQGDIAGFQDSQCPDPMGAYWSRRRLWSEIDHPSNVSGLYAPTASTPRVSSPL